MSVRIITDSASDISKEYGERLGARVIPLRFFFGEDSYRDGIDMGPDEFYKRMKEEEELPKTSQITPFEYHEIFEEETKDGNEAVYLAISSGVSGSAGNAAATAEEFDGKVKVFDTGHFCISQRVLTEYAKRLADEGLDASQIIEKLKEASDKVRIIAVFETLENLRRGGRISSASAFFGDMLGIRLMITISEGIVKVLGKARGMKKAMKEMRDYIRKEEIDLSMPYAFGYTGSDPGNMDAFIGNNKDLFGGNTDVEVSRVGATVGTYAGDGAIAAAYFVK